MVAKSMAPPKPKPELTWEEEEVMDLNFLTYLKIL